jgi:hypothetical protein
MKQVTQTLRTGAVGTKEVPVPTLGDKYILVQNNTSIISAGTEKSKIDMGKKNLLQKAKARPDLVKQVLAKIKTEGIQNTLQTVNSRLDESTPLGYSSTGSVVAVETTKAGKSPILNDNLCITLSFRNGSIANIIYTADGSRAMAKDAVEVFGGGKSGVLHDFKEVVLYSGDTEVHRKKLGAQDKGQKLMLSAWISGLKSGSPCLDYDCLMATSMASIMAVESMTIGMPVTVDLVMLDSEI